MIIELKKITKQYEDKKAVNNIDIIISEGSFTVILGPSGSGKTTLLRIIAGLIYPTSGRVFFEKKDMTDLPASKRNIAMVFQKYTLFPHMTVEENIKFPLESIKEGKLFKTKIHSEEEIRKKVEETLKLLHIEEHRDKYPSQLSGGEQQRVAIGREVIRDPVLFLFDEPLSNIDARLRYEMRTWIRRLHKIIKKTTVYVTHDQGEAMALGSQIALLNEGKIEQYGTPDELYYNPVNKFTAQFIGNYPMNFIPFQYKEKKLLYKNGKKIEVPKNLIKIIESKKVKSGDIGFRAEYIREFDATKPVDKEMILMDCEIEDIEKVLDQQILTLKHEEIQLFFVTKTKKEFQKNESLSIVVHSDHIYIFNSKGMRVQK